MPKLPPPPTIDPQTEPGLEPVVVQAFLYASGELEPEEAAAFESRLGEDQSAREALVRAMSMVQALSLRVPARPHPTYRAQVRQRLRRGSYLSWLLRRRPYRGHPLVWSTLGAMAAAVLVVVMAQAPAALVAQPHPPLPGPRGPADLFEPAPIIDPPQLVATPDVANSFANLYDPQRVIRVHDEEMSRKQRQELNRQTKAAERRPRPLSNQAPKN